MGIMQGKTILVTGVLTDHSIAFSVAKIIQEEGGTVLISSFGRAMGATERANARLPHPAKILELDVTSEENLSNLAAEIKKHSPTLDGVVHAIGFAPQSALGGNFLSTEWPDVATALQVSAYSFKSL